MHLNKIIQYLVFLFFLTGFSIHLLAQADSTRTELLLSDNKNKVETIDFSLLDTTQQTSEFSFKKKPYLLGFKSKVGDYFNPPSGNRKSSSADFLSGGTGENEDDSDILVKKYFNGKDVSDVQLSSDFSLGTLYSTSKSVRIEVRDHSLIDGDRIRVYLNEKMIASSISLKGLYYIIRIDLIKGYNRVDIEALNEGYSGPNTAEIKIFDEDGVLLSEREWNIRIGQITTLGVVRD
ncbi:MAG TPA: hypothetical protein DDZ39_12900 [Flavobacteriaceae bacterium]|jgi:hypothetical protein|nr:hypothetical protein [Flavobacteriaceae bacterium]HBS12335.1 hypothetical protein [Flavobacteriaceae bacterium]